MLRFEFRILEHGQDHFLDQLMRQPTATAVAEDDRFVIENGCRTGAENHQMTSSSPNATWIMSHSTWIKVEWTS